MTAAPDLSAAAGRRAWRVAALAVVVALALALLTIALFERAYPLVDVGLRLTREQAIERARALAAAERWAPPTARAAARFQSDEALATYVDLAAGGPDSVRALARGRDAALYSWAVRLFEPGSPRQAYVSFAPDGRVIGVIRQLPEDERRPLVSEADGRAAADAALARWGGGAPVSSWSFGSASFTTQPRSGRVDRTYRYTLAGRRVGEAPVRAEVVVSGADSGRAATGQRGDVLGVRTFVDVPESWGRRYREMRSANDLYAQLSLPGTLIFAVGAVMALVRWRDVVRWRPALLVGGTIGTFMLLGALNDLPLSWFDYDTAEPTGTFVTMAIVGAIAAGVGTTMFVAAAVAAAEVLTRRAFPRHADWYAYLRHRGTGEVASHVLGGYALAALGFAYVSLFYLTTRRLLGWWVPTGSLDDPNQIATPLPWVSAIGTSLFAGVWEEAIFRAVPLALLSLWVGQRPTRRWWLAGGVIVTALVFGFGHANYPSWPAYARGVELFLEAALWAVLYLTVGLPTTIVAHVLYDLAWFGLFALHGEGTAYRTTAVVVVAAGLLPALLVVQGALARRRAQAAGRQLAATPPRFADWRPRELASFVEEDEAPTALAPQRPGRIRQLVALGVGAAAAVLAIALPPRPSLGPAFTAPRDRVAAVADSALRAAGADPARWTRTLAVREGTSAPSTRRFLRDSLGRARAVATVQALATTYLPGPVWEARYVRRTGSVAERAESWRVIVRPDGAVRKVTHQIPAATPGDSLTVERARAGATAALRARATDPARLREVGVTLVPRPARVDAVVEWEDPAVALPGGARARVQAAVVGAEVVDVQRDVRLPEAWERTDRERASRRTAAGVVGLMLVVAVAFGLAWRALRRAPREELPAGRDRLGRGGAVAVGLAAALVFVARYANGIEQQLTDWPTEQPWSTYLGTMAMGALVSAAMLGAVAAGGWSLLDALRRRAALPWVPAGPDGPRQAAIAGLGLAGVPALLGLLGGRFRPGSWPGFPTTVLGERLPWLAEVLDGASAMLLQPLVLIAVLILLLGVRRPAARIAALLLPTLAFVPIVQDEAGTMLAVLATVAGLAGIGWLFWTYGRGSVLAWVLGGLLGTVLTALRNAREATTNIDRVASVLSLAFAVVLLALVWRYSTRRSATDEEAPTRPSAVDLPTEPVTMTG